MMIQTGSARTHVRLESLYVVRTCTPGLYVCTPYAGPVREPVHPAVRIRTACAYGGPSYALARTAVHPDSYSNLYRLVRPHAVRPYAVLRTTHARIHSVRLSARTSYARTLAATSGMVSRELVRARPYEVSRTARCVHPSSYAVRCTSSYLVRCTAVRVPHAVRNRTSYARTLPVHRSRTRNLVQPDTYGCRATAVHPSSYAWRVRLYAVRRACTQPRTPRRTSPYTVLGSVQASVRVRTRTRLVYSAARTDPCETVRRARDENHSPQIRYPQVGRFIPIGYTQQWRNSQTTQKRAHQPPHTETINDFSHHR